MNIISFKEEWAVAVGSAHPATRKKIKTEYQRSGYKVVAGPWGGAGFFVPVRPGVVVRGPWKL